MPQARSASSTSCSVCPHSNTAQAGEARPPGVDATEPIRFRATAPPHGRSEERSLGRPGWTKILGEGYRCSRFKNQVGCPACNENYYQAEEHNRNQTHKAAHLRCEHFAQIDRMQEYAAGWLRQSAANGALSRYVLACCRSVSALVWNKVRCGRLRLEAFATSMCIGRLVVNARSMSLFLRREWRHKRAVRKPDIGGLLKQPGSIGNMNMLLRSDRKAVSHWNRLRRGSGQFGKSALAAFSLCR